MSIPTQELIEAGKNTRFGSKGGADPSAAATKRNNDANPSQIRSAMKRLAAAEFDITQDFTPAELLKKFGRNGVVVSGAQLIAVKKFQIALKKGDVKMLQQVTDDVDGKQIERKAEAQVSYAELVAGSFLDEPDDTESEQGEQGSEG